MFEPDQYQLLDFGAGRKLERFGSEILDRPSPAADGHDRSDGALWQEATARFEPARRSGGEWVTGAEFSNEEEASPWAVRHGDSRLVMQLGPSGNVGCFPEQATNWDWIADQVRMCRGGLSDRAPRVLNLFAYTGGASLAAAAAGAEVTHVDSSGPTVAVAKRNAALSGLADLPIRWLVDDALKFVAREGRRGNRYDGIIADPPTYGHGPKGRPFKFQQHLDELMAGCGALLEPTGTGNRFLVFSCHAPGFTADDAAATARSVARAAAGAGDHNVTGDPLVLKAADGRTLAAGVSARWTSSPS